MSSGPLHPVGIRSVYSGRILISAMGLVVAMLPVTGVYIWRKKRAARLKSAAHRRVGGEAGVGAVLD